MLRVVGDSAGEHFAFDQGGVPAHGPGNSHDQPATGENKTFVAIDHGPDGPSATISNAHLMFTAHFARTGNDLVLHGDGDKTYVVQDYFASGERARLLSADGAALSPDVVEALTGPQAPGQYAQAGGQQARVQAVGRVAAADSDATIVRNGVAIAAHAGDAVLKGDVLQTVNGTIAVTFTDGSTLNLTAHSRMVVNEFVYQPNGNGNSQLLNLVQGSLTFISGEVAHTGNMKIGTPVATMGIRGTVGGVTTANDGTVHFYVSQSATGAVIIDSSGNVIANVVQDGPMIVVRPVGPLQVIAEEVQKSPQQLATELAALQQIINIKAVGDQLLQQFLQNPDPKSTHFVHTQIPVDIHTNQTGDNHDDSHNGDNGVQTFVSATVTLPPPEEASEPTVIEVHIPPNEPTVIEVHIPPNEAPISFSPLTATTNEDNALSFTGATAISVFDPDTDVLTVTLTATHGVLNLSGVAGLSFGGGANGSATMTFSGSQAAINAALNGMTLTPDHDYSGPASVQIVTSDGNTTSPAQTVAVTVNAANDAPVLALDQSTQQTSENTPLAFSAGAIRVSDVDTAVLTVTLVAAVGTLSLSQTTGLSFANGADGHQDASMTFSGTQADINAALDSLSYTPAHEFAGQTSLTIEVSDGQAAPVTDVVNITVQPEAPTLIVVHDTLVAEPGGAVLLGIAVLGRDLDDQLSVTISNLSDGDSLTNLWGDHLAIVNGSITLNPLQLIGLSLHPGSASGDDLMITASNTENGVTSAPVEHPLSVVVDAAPVAHDDSIITNVQSGTAFQIPDWVLLQNDTDADTAPDHLGVTDVNLVVSASANHADDHVTFTEHYDLVDFFNNLAHRPSGGSFNYTVSDRLVSDSGHVTVALDTRGNLDGSSHNDILIGKAGGSTILGNGGNDILIANTGHDQMTGGSGADTFVFKPGGGADTIIDFAASGPGHDLIALDDYGFASYADLAGHIGGTGNTTTIDLGGGDVLTFNNTNQATLIADDFIFHPHVILA